MQVTAGAKVLASEKSMAVMEEDTEGGTVCIKLYSLEDISNPQEVRKVIHQGELFDFYQSPGNSYTLVTSVSVSYTHLDVYKRQRFDHAQ